MGNVGGARLNGVGWGLTAAAGVMLFLRVYCKLWRCRGLWWDDHFLIISWVRRKAIPILERHCLPVLQLSLTIAVSINTYIVSLGFGLHMSEVSTENLKTINLFTILVACFGIISTTTSKTSFSLMLYRITVNVWVKRFLIFGIISVNVFLNLVWIFGLAKCTPTARVWDKSVPGTCWNLEKLAKFQLFAACGFMIIVCGLQSLTNMDARLFRHPRLCPRLPAMADSHGPFNEAP